MSRVVHYKHFFQHQSGDIRNGSNVPNPECQEMNYNRIWNLGLNHFYIGELKTIRHAIVSTLNSIWACLIPNVLSSHLDQRSGQPLHLFFFISQRLYDQISIIDSRLHSKNTSTHGGYQVDVTSRRLVGCKKDVGQTVESLCLSSCPISICKLHFR